jgi:hypothetical protein
LVEDNLSALIAKQRFMRVYAPQRARAILERVTFVHTPKHGSWLNVAEIELSVLNRVALKKRMESKEKFLEQIKAYEQLKNHQAIP